MQRIPCPITELDLRHLYLGERLTDAEIAARLGEGATVKRVRSWRAMYGIATIQKWERHDVPPIEGRLRSLLIGSMLGDGGMAKVAQAARYYENHALEQKDYLFWKAQQWGSWVPTPPAPVTWKTKTGDFPGYRFHTVSHASLNELYDLFYESQPRTQKGEKRVIRNPKRLKDSKIVDLVDPFALAIWYLDDGTASWWPEICFGMPPESREVATSILEKFGLHPRWKQGSVGPTGYFEFQEEEATKFRALITPHVPVCMAYKLSFGYDSGRNNLIRLHLDRHQEEIRGLAEQGVSIRQMAIHLAVTEQSLSRYLERHEIPHPRSPGSSSAARSAEIMVKIRAEDAVEQVFEDLRRQGFPSDPPQPLEPVLRKLRATSVGFVEGVMSTTSPTGTMACKPYFPNRYKASWRGTQTAWEAWDDDRRLRAAIRYQLEQGDPVTPHRVLRAVSMQCRTPSVFRPLVMKAICERHCPTGGWVWDPCAGYGGRLLGAFAAGAHYIGTDVEPETVDGNRRLAEDLGSSALIFQIPAQEAQVGRKVDLVFTSPPYFDIERYGHSAGQSSIVFTTFEAWAEGFLGPMIRQARSHLREGGVMALNVADKRARSETLLVDRVGQEALAQGFHFVERLWMPIKSLNRSGQAVSEPILVFRKT